jgi:hypothetical protein
MNTSFQKGLFGLLLLACWTCEADVDETPSGYVISALVEVNGQKRVDRTNEITWCRRNEVWVFDLPNKQVDHDLIYADCDGFTKKNAATEFCDTLYVDSLSGNYLVLAVPSLNAPVVHPEFRMTLNAYQKERRLDKLFYRLVKFNQEELIILNQYNTRQIPRDTQYFEMTMKYVEQ